MLWTDAATASSSSAMFSRWKLARVSGKCVMGINQLTALKV